jgi:CRISPR-associated protein Csm2
METIKFFTSDNRFRTELLDKEAFITARSFVKYLHKKTGKWEKKENALSPTQLRRFFNEVKLLEKRYRGHVRALSKTREVAFEEIKGGLLMLKARALYAAASGERSEKIPKEFKEFILKCVNSTHTPDDFEAFVKHFEAVVGHFYWEEKDANRSLRRNQR